MRKIKLPWIIAVIIAIALVLIGAKWPDEVNTAKNTTLTGAKTVWDKIVLWIKYLTGKISKKTEEITADDKKE